MPTPVNFTPLTDPFIWFANVQAFNAWAGALSVSIGSSDLPAATTIAIGAVYKAAVVTYSIPAVAATYLSINTGDGTTELPSKDYVDALKTKLDALAVKFDDLLTKVKAAGQMATS